MHSLDQFDFHHRLADTPGTSLVLFGSEDCGSCRQVRLLLQRMSEQSDTGMTCFYVDAQRDTALVREFEVFHLPSLFLFKDGEFHCELHSSVHPEALLRAVDQALAAPAQEAP